MELIIILLIGISLSMDAFSLSLVYGTLQLPRNYMFFLSFIVGIFHFVMPLIGIFFGNIIVNYIYPNIVGGIVFIFIGLSMFIDSFKNRDSVYILSIIEIILFGMAVSVDSFSLGLGLNNFTDKYLLSSFIFSLFSFIFTFLGLMLGKNISFKIGKLSTILGGIILSSIGIVCLFN